MTSTPADGTSALEQLLHDLVYVMLAQEASGQTLWPCKSCTLPVRLTVTAPQYEVGTSTANRYMLSLPGYCIILAEAPLGPDTEKSVVLSEATGSEKVTKNSAESAVVVGTPLG